MCVNHDHSKKKLQQQSVLERESNINCLMPEWKHNYALSWSISFWGELQFFYLIPLGNTRSMQKFTRND